MVKNKYLFYTVLALISLSCTCKHGSKSAAKADSVEQNASAPLEPSSANKSTSTSDTRAIKPAPGKRNPAATDSLKKELYKEKQK